MCLGPWVEVAQCDFLAYKSLDLLESCFVGWRPLEICIILKQLAEYGCILRQIWSKWCQVCRDPKELSQLHCIVRGLQLADSSDLLRVMVDPLTAEL